MNKLNISLFGVALVAVVVWSAAFIVKESETAIKLRLGKIEEFGYEPGLHFKLPLINNVLKFDARIQALDNPPERYLTGEKMNVDVDSFAKWKIDDVKRYYVTTGGDMRRANIRLSQILKDGLRGEFAKRSLHEVISEDRNEIMEIITKDADAQMEEFGIKVVDVRIKRVDMTKGVSDRVHQRMNAERERIAKEHRSQGREAAERIRAETDRQRTVMLAKARQESEELRGNGDAKATEIYARAYGKDKDFYAFYRSLEAYKKSFNNQGDLIMLNPDSEFFQYFGKTGK